MNWNRVPVRMMMNKILKTAYVAWYVIWFIATATVGQWLFFSWMFGLDLVMSDEASTILRGLFVMICVAFIGWLPIVIWRIGDEIP